MKKIIFLLGFIATITVANAQLKLGDNIPAITLKNESDLNVDVTSFKGKIVLIDFWASWCAPCRAANKKLVQLYSKYNKQNFEIIGISIDKNKKMWETALTKDKINFKKLIDSKGFDAKSAAIFGVEQLPASFLFDKNGKLVAINPTESEIINLIKK